MLYGWYNPHLMAGPEPDWVQRIKEAMAKAKPPKPNPYGLEQGYIYGDKKGPVVDPNNLNITEFGQVLGSEIQQRVDTSFLIGLQRRVYKTYWDRFFPYYNLLSIGEIPGTADPWRRLKLAVYGNGGEYFSKYHVPDITLHLGIIDSLGTHTLGVEYNRSNRKSDVRKFSYEKHTDEKIRVGDRVFADWNAAHDYIYGRGLDTNIKEACGLLRSLGEHSLDPDAELDNLGDKRNDNQEYGATVRIKAALEQEAEDAPEDQEINYSNWGEEKVGAFIGGIKARTQRLLFPYLMSSDVNYTVDEINRTVVRVALETAPLYAKYMHRLITEKQQDKGFKLIVNQALSTILFHHYRKVQQTDLVKVNYEHERDGHFGLTGRFNISFTTFKDFSGDNVVNSGVVSPGERYTFDGTDYIVDREGNSLLFIARDCAQPTRGFYVTFRARDINMRRMLKAAQTYQASGWEKALNYLPAQISVTG